MIDTSWGGSLSGVPNPFPTPVNLTIRNSSEKRKSPFAFWSFPSYDIIAILEPDSSRDLGLTWSIRFDYPDSNLTLPTLGDTCHLEIAEPFSMRDVYLFSSQQFVVGIRAAGAIIPDDFALRQNYLNPFNPETTVQFEIPKPSRVILKVYDILGREVKSLLTETLMPGTYRVRWDGSDRHGNFVSSGIYFYRLMAGDFAKTRKMILLR